ncbi:hypothetical protein I3843_15G064500 [Carya illinoinensis]|nr:hypothetical protein I3843_15G064500 [Carya illinoinensis]
MELQSVCRGLPTPKLGFSTYRLLSHQSVSANQGGLRDEKVPVRITSKSHLMPGLKRVFKKSSVLGSERRVIICATKYNPDEKLQFSGRENSDSGLAASGINGAEPFRGKSGSISFYGLTHQSVEEGKLQSAPFNEEKSSFLWALAPVALISSLILPQFFFSEAIEYFLGDVLFVELVTSLLFEVLFYIGISIFLLVTDRVQRPYLQFSPKRWGLITGLRGYLTSAFFTMGIKVIAPILAVAVNWPIIGLPSLIAVVPFLFGCLVQLAFEKFVDMSGSSCWPLVPIIFEVYRLYQLTKAAHFIEKLLLTLKGRPSSPELLERSGALFSMISTFQVLGIVCLWSLLTFLLRLFPSRPVAEKY